MATTVENIKKELKGYMFSSDFVVEYIKDIPAERTEVERIKNGFYLK